MQSRPEFQINLELITSDLFPTPQTGVTRPKSCELLDEIIQTEWVRKQKIKIKQLPQLIIFHASKQLQKKKKVPRKIESTNLCIS